MSTAELIPIYVAAFIACLGALGAFIQGIRNSGALKETQATLTAQNNDADLKGRAIFNTHLLVNDNLTKEAAERYAVTRENADLRARLAAATGNAGDAVAADQAAALLVQPHPIVAAPTPPPTIAEQIAGIKKPENSGTPPAPPLPLIVMTLALAMGGCCTSDRCVAITTANLMHDAGEASAEALRLGCTERYAKAETKADIAALDTGCLPAAAAYGSFRRAFAVLVTRLASGDATFTAVLATAQQAAFDLADKLSEVPR